MVSPGVVPADVLSDFARSGVSWYACYQETHNRDLFKKLRPGQNYAARMENKKLAVKLGLLTEEGLLCSVGESAQDIADSITSMRLLEVSQIRAMTFVPQAGTPMQTWKRPDPLREMLIIAVLRLAFPDRLIPASLDVDGLPGCIAGSQPAPMWSPRWYLRALAWPVWLKILWILRMPDGPGPAFSPNWRNSVWSRRRLKTI